MTGIIYKITNNINGKVYIGKTLETLETRWNQHQKDSKRFPNRPLYRAINKYGIENFIIEIIEKPEIDILSERESYWIKYYNSYRSGYNATLGGDGRVLYDYQQIVNKYLEGFLLKEIAEEFECSIDTVSKVLNLAKVDSTINQRKKKSKAVYMCDNNNEIIQKFGSFREAAEWLINNNIAKTNDRDNVVAAIGRVVNGHRKTAYKKIWRLAD